MTQLKTSYLLLLGLLCIFLLFSVGCQQAQSSHIDPVLSTPNAPESSIAATATATATVVPSETPTTTPTATPTPTPTSTPTPTPTPTPTQTQAPTATPTVAKTPTKAPTQAPTKAPTKKPTVAPTPTPTIEIPHIALTPTALPDTIDPKKPMVALTFDDGPNPSVTNRILDTLEKYNARATFFVVGNRLSANKESNTYKAVTRAYALGCEIGNHSYTHPKLTTLSVSKVQDEIAKTNDGISKIIGKPATLFRPPYALINDVVRAKANAPLILWSVDTEDWKSRNAASVYNRTVPVVKNGDIILMHDLYTSTAEACETIIPALLEQGYQLVTVSELFACKGITLTTGVSYYSGR